MAQETTTATAKPRTLKIRMKPGCGRMMIGRQWRLSDGTLSDTLPRDMQERMNPEDSWLEARKVSSDGVASDGPIAEVSESLVRKFLNAKGVPSRVIDGYRMVRVPGQETPNDDGELTKSRDSWSPSKEMGAFEDCTFEIVRE
jgi:hypothetical protein